MAKDIFHQAVRTALEKDGWIITHDPYPLRLLGVEGDIDLGAERVLGAERSVENNTEKIAVEIKSFLSPSFMRDFHTAVGQYTNYRILLSRKEVGRVLYLAVPSGVYFTRFQAPGVELICQEADVRLLIFNEIDKLIAEWKR